ncbi:MAG: hypothetical protein KF708_04305 [Pirellulales bacterium]|nr:hypothetical protein [Pirellulales bacterium]
MRCYFTSRRAGIVALVLLLLAGGASVVRAQEPKDKTAPHPVLDREISLGELHPTPEMWFYQQEMRNFLDPKMAVRRRAEFRATQRQHRIASSQWFGQSKARPTASATPFTDSYSPSWVGNSGNPFNWAAVGNRQVVIRTARPNVSSFDIW